MLDYPLQKGSEEAEVCALKLLDSPLGQRIVAKLASDVEIRVLLRLAFKRGKASSEPLEHSEPLLR